MKNTTAQQQAGRAYDYYRQENTELNQLEDEMLRVKMKMEHYDTLQMWATGSQLRTKYKELSERHTTKALKVQQLRRDWLALETELVKGGNQ